MQNKKDIEDFKEIFFLGIGGIGMSALARYYHGKGYRVSGYDLTPSPLIDDLIELGIEVVFDSALSAIDLERLSPDKTLVIYTPAIPQGHEQLVYFQSHPYRICKRAEALGLITRDQATLCVAGTHGKTTTSTMLAHLMNADPEVGSSAFLGGLSNNFKSNFVYSDSSDYVVAEADEFDRSFLHLYPDKAIVTSVDADHLDIYGDHASLLEAFNAFVSQIRDGGVLLVRHGLSLDLPSHVRTYTYGDSTEADVYYSNVRILDGRMFFDWHFPAENVHLQDLEIGVPVRINIENATAAMGIALLSGVDSKSLQEGIRSFRGSHRRFETVLQNASHILIDDYAHHPKELEVAISSVKELYPDKPLLGIFQPHLYSRTASFYEDFARSLSLLDEVILLDIYPAREEPMPGITSQIIFDLITIPSKVLMPKEELLDYLRKRAEELPPVVMMMGAGNIDRLVMPVKDLLASL